MLCLLGELDGECLLGSMSRNVSNFDNGDCVSGKLDICKHQQGIANQFLLSWSYSSNCVHKSLCCVILTVAAHTHALALTKPLTCTHTHKHCTLSVMGRRTTCKVGDKLTMLHHALQSGVPGVRVSGVCKVYFFSLTLCPRDDHLKPPAFHHSCYC